MKDPEYRSRNLPLNSTPGANEELTPGLPVLTLFLLRPGTQKYCPPTFLRPCEPGAPAFHWCRFNVDSERKCYVLVYIPTHSFTVLDLFQHNTKSLTIAYPRLNIDDTDTTWYRNFYVHIYDTSEMLYNYKKLYQFNRPWFFRCK